MEKLTVAWPSYRSVPRRGFFVLRWPCRHSSPSAPTSSPSRVLSGMAACSAATGASTRSRSTRRACCASTRPRPGTPPLSPSAPTSARTGVISGMAACSAGTGASTRSRPTRRACCASTRPRPYVPRARSQSVCTTWREWAPGGDRSRASTRARGRRQGGGLISSGQSMCRST